MTPASQLEVLGKNPFHTVEDSGIAYLGTEWASNPHVRKDISVSELIQSQARGAAVDRVAELIQLMDIDPNWRMNTVSDGERRRVQIVLGLMHEWRVYSASYPRLLLDEVTVDLDVLVRSRLIAYLVKETEVRKATIVYATHIFDGLDAFPSRLVHLRDGAVLKDLSDVSGTIERAGSLHKVALEWLTQDFNSRGEAVVRESKWDEKSENMESFSINHRKSMAIDFTIIGDGEIVAFVYNLFSFSISNALKPLQ